MKTEYKYIRFSDIYGDDWVILNKRSGDIIGSISYYDPWGQFVADFKDLAIFNNQCLRDIADFLDQLNAEKKK